jgi:hypothetical protein
MAGRQPWPTPCAGSGMPPTPPVFPARTFFHPANLSAPGDKSARGIGRPGPGSGRRRGGGRSPCLPPDRHNSASRFIFGEGPAVPFRSMFVRHLKRRETCLEWWSGGSKLHGTEKLDPRIVPVGTWARSPSPCEVSGDPLRSLNDPEGPRAGGDDSPRYTRLPADLFHTQAGSRGLAAPASQVAPHGRCRPIPSTSFIVKSRDAEGMA